MYTLQHPLQLPKDLLVTSHILIPYHAFFLNYPLCHISVAFMGMYLQVCGTFTWSLDNFLVVTSPILKKILVFIQYPITANNSSAR